MIDQSNDVEFLVDLLKAKDEENLISFIASHNYFSRMEIAKTYKATHGEDLTKKINSCLSSDFNVAYQALFTPRIDFLCEKIYKSMKGAGTDEDALIQTLTTCSNEEIIAIVPRYQELYNAKLEEDIIGDTSGYFKEALISLIQAQRNQNQYPNVDECEELTGKLKAYFEGNDKKDKSIFNMVFSLRSCQEVEYIVRAFHRMTGKTILEEIEKNFKGDDLNMLSSWIFAIVNPAEFFATLLNKYLMKKKEEYLIRILVSQCERNRMWMIKTFYRQLYRKELQDDIKEKYKGSLGNLFVQLIEN